MKHLQFFSLIILISMLCVPSSAQWCGTQYLYFQNQVSPDIPGYEQLINYPSGAPEKIENVTVNLASGPVLIDTYISPVGYPGSLMIERGLRRYRTFAYVDSAVGTTRLNFTPFVRYANGSERNLYTVMSDDINDLAVNEYLTSYVSPVDLDLSPSATTRLGIRITANTTHPSNIKLSWVYEGTYHYSSVESGYFVCPEVFPESNQQTGSDAMSLIFGLLGGIIASVLILRRLKP